MLIFLEQYRSELEAFSVNLPNQRQLADKNWSKKFNWWWRSIFWAPETSKRIVARRKTRIADIASPEIDDSEDGMLAGLDWAIRRVNSETDWLRALWSSYETSAFLYEGVKRRTGQYEFGMDWVHLTPEQRSILRQRWPEPDVEQIVEIQIDTAELSRSGWSNLIRHRWNLKCSNDSIADRFNRVIVQQRNQFNIVPPRIVRKPVAEWREESVTNSIDREGWTKWFVTRWNLNSNTSSLLEDFRRRIDQLRIQFPNPRPNSKRRNRGRSWMGIEAMDLATAGEILDDKHRWAKQKAEREIDRALIGPS